YYKPGNPALFKGLGRTASDSAGEGTEAVEGLSFLQFDGATDLLVKMQDQIYYTSSALTATVWTSRQTGLDSNAIHLNTAHYLNEHYLLNGFDRHVLQSDATTRQHGMAPVTVAPTIVTTAADAGGNTIIFTLSGSDGDGSGNIAVNYLKDGILCVDMGQVGAVYQMRIKSNTVLTGDGGGAMTIVVDEPFPLAVTTSMYIEAMATPYSGLINSGVSSRASYLGLPQRDATSVLPYNWILTHGPCWVTPNNGLAVHNLGNANYSNQVVAHPSEFGGSVGPHDDAYALTVYQQHVGFVLSWAQAETQGAPFIMLNISS
ncbi:hypothetical protein LCGC14_1255240, partial [marine sediment metagenome]